MMVQDYKGENISEIAEKCGYIEICRSEVTLK